MDPCWVFFEISRDDVDFEPSMPDPVEEAMTKELCRRVERFSRSRPLSLFSGAQHQHSELLEALQSPLALLDPQFGQDEMITPYGIPNTRAWKLSKQFQEKYHFIDCSSGMMSSHRNPYSPDSSTENTANNVMPSMYIIRDSYIVLKVLNVDHYQDT